MDLSVVGVGLGLGVHTIKLIISTCYKADCIMLLRVFFISLVSLYSSAVCKYAGSEYGIDEMVTVHALLSMLAYSVLFMYFMVARRYNLGTLLSFNGGSGAPRLKPLIVIGLAPVMYIASYYWMVHIYADHEMSKITPYKVAMGLILGAIASVFVFDEKLSYTRMAGITGMILSAYLI
jgi:multidrug transporter EmrE-like cation transporter